MTAWRTARAFLPALAWAALIWFIGGLQTVPVSASLTRYDKVAHLVMYGVLGFLCGRGWNRVGGPFIALAIIVLALLLGAGDEWRQARVAVRTGDVADWIADAAGVITGFLFAALRARQRQDAHERT